MEEVIYNIEIHKNEGKYLGKIYSDIDGVKEFKNKYVDRLLRDMTIDMQFLFDEFSSHHADSVEDTS